MKKGVLFTSLISALLFFAGIVFKMFHWSFAHELLILGATIGIVFLILYMVSGTKLQQRRVEQANIIFVAITMIIVLVWFTFKANHYPGDHLLLLVSHISMLLSGILMFVDAFYEVNSTKQFIKCLIAFIYFIFMSILVFMAMGISTCKTIN